MLAFGKQSRSILAASALAFGLLLLGACSGGGGGNSLSPSMPQQPAAIPAQSVHASIPLSDVGTAVALPPLAGYGESITLTSNSAPAGTNLAMTISTNMPKSVPAMPPDFKETQGFLYFSISSSKTVTLNGFPGFTLTIPAGLTWDGGTLHLGFYDPSVGWEEIGDVSLSGRTMTFTPTKTPLTLKAGVNYVVVPFACVEPSPSPSPSPTPTGVISCAASGTGAIGVTCTGNKTYAFVGTGLAGKNTIEQIDISKGATANSSAAPTHTYSTTGYEPTECSADNKHQVVFCAGFSSGEMTDINATAFSSADFLGTSETTELGFSGGACIICAVAFDNIDDAFIIETPDSSASGCRDQCGEFVRLPEAPPHTANMTIATGDPNENPGYDYVKNWVFNPGYGSAVLQVLDFGTGKIYTTSSSISNIETPDSAAVDVSTHIGETPNEGGDIVTVALLGSATLSGSTLTVTTGQTTLTHNNDGGLDNDATAIDSVIHVVSLEGEFGTRNLGFAQLEDPSHIGTTISDWAYAPFPNTPDGNPWFSARDPHPITAFNSPTGCPDCAISINTGFTYMAVIDLDKLRHAKRSSSDVHTIDPSVDLEASHILAYYKL